MNKLIKTIIAESKDHYICDHEIQVVNACSQTFIRWSSSSSSFHVNSNTSNSSQN